MISVSEISENKYVIYRKNILLPGIFYKVERLSDDCNIYCLWLDKKEFLIYNATKNIYALKSTLSGACIFKRIKYYSEHSKSFVACRSDNDYHHIIYEDGYYDSHIFKFVGEEVNGCRAVQGFSDKWNFYDTTERHIIKLKNDGFSQKLGMMYSSGVFIIYYASNKFKLTQLYDGKLIYSKDHFDEVEEIEERYYICKLFGKNVYTIIKESYLITPIGYYTNKPKYLKNHNLFVALKGNSWCVIKHGKEIQNSQWIDDDFVFTKDYIFNKSKKSECWNIFKRDNAQLVPHNWSNIRIDVNGKIDHIIVDTEAEKNQVVFIDDIEKLSREFVNSLKSQVKTEKRIVGLKKEITPDNHTKTSAKKIDNQHARQYEMKISKRIDYLIFLKSKKIREDKMTINSSLDCSFIKGTKYIVWFITDSNSYVITASNNNKFHKIIYLKNNCDVCLKLKESSNIIYKQFYNVDINFLHEELNIGLNFDDLLFTAVSKVLNKHEDDSTYVKQYVSSLHSPVNASDINPESEKSNEVNSNTENKLEEQARDTVLNAKDVKANILKQKQKAICNFLEIHTPKSISNKMTTFIHDRNRFTIEINQICDFDIYFRQKFIFKANESNIFILLDFITDNVYIDNGCLYYSVCGVGKDKRFDQDFRTNANTLMRNSLNLDFLKLFVFMNSSDNKLIFLDEVKCVDYSVVKEEETKRDVIYFKLKSLLRTECDIEQTPSEDIIDEIDSESEIDEETTNNNLQNSMEELDELYSLREKVKKLGIVNDELEKQLKSLENKIISDKISAQLKAVIEPILKQVNNDLSFVVDYKQNEGVSINFTPAKRVDIKEELPSLRTNRKEKQLVVTFPDGIIINENKVIDTLAKSICKIGIQKVAMLCKNKDLSPLRPSGVELVTNSYYHDKQKEFIKGWYLFSNTSTIQKKIQLDTISDALQLKLKTQII